MPDEKREGQQHDARRDSAQTFEVVLVNALQRVFWPLIVLGLPALAAGIVTEARVHERLTIFLYVFAYSCGVVAAFKSTVGYRVRVGALVLALYVLGLAELARYGTGSRAYLLFLALIMFAAIYFPKRVGASLLGIIVVTVVVLSYLHLENYITVDTSSEHAMAPAVIWFGNSATLVMLAIVVLTLTGVLVDSLRANMAASTALVKDLLAQVREREGVELALRESESELRQVIDLVPQSIYAKDKDSRFIFVNRRSSELMGTTPEQAVGKTQSELTKKEDEANALTAEDKEVLEKGVPVFGREHVYTDPHGVQHIEEITKIPFITRRTQGLAILGISVDVTDRKAAEVRLRESEEHFRTLIENVSEVVLEIDSTGTIRYASPSVTRVLGYLPENVTRLRIPEIVHPDDIKSLSKAAALVEQGAGAPVKVECRVRHENGSWVDIEAVGKLALDSDRPVRAIVTCRDVTERKRGEAERERLESDLRQAQKMEAFGQLAGGVAHDFNNLLQGMLGYTEMVSSRLDPGDSNYAQLRIVQSVGERAASLTRQLLAFGRKQVLEPKYINLNIVIADFSKMLGRLIGEHITLCTHLAENLAQVYADRSQIELVIMNLCVNARDAMPNGGTITITTSNESVPERFRASHDYIDPGSYVRIEVADNGSGMELTVLRHVFEPFFTTKETGAGTGLGLATVYGIVRQHHGVVNVESSIGEGSKFSVYLPTKSGAEEERVEDVATETPGGTETILIAEDDETVREVATNMLTRAGYRVLAAVDGEDAVRQYVLNEGHIDLLVLDVIMPKLGGYGVYERITQYQERQAALFTSGYAVSDGRTSPVISKHVGFLQKPYSRQDFLQKIRQLLDARA